MAAVNFSKRMAAADFTKALGVHRLVPGKNVDLHVHKDLVLRDPIEGTMCGCGSCELFDCYHGIRKRREVNHLRFQEGVQVGKFPKVHEPLLYDSGREFGKDGTDITVLGPEVLDQLRDARNDPSRDEAVVQDRLVQRDTVRLGQAQQARRNDTAHEGLLDAIAKVNAYPETAASLLGVSRSKKHPGAKRSAEAPPADPQERLKFAAQPRGTVPVPGKS